MIRVIKSRRLRWTGHVTRMEEYRRSFKILTGIPTRKRPLRSPRRRWVTGTTKERDLQEGLGVYGKTIL